TQAPTASPTANAQVTPKPPSPAAHHSPGRSGSAPRSGRRSGANVRSPVHPPTIARSATAGTSASSFEATSARASGSTGPLLPGPNPGGSTASSHGDSSHPP